jgi:hypothetical protein
MEGRRDTDQSRRNVAFNLCYYIALAVLSVAVIWHWVFGGHWVYFGTVATWAVCAFIVLGFLNAIGLFGRR